MKKLLFILCSEKYTDGQIREAIEIARIGRYSELFEPTPDGQSRLHGKIQYRLPLTTFKCRTVIVPADILKKIKENYHSTGKNIHLTLCDLVDPWRCEVNRVAAIDAGFSCEVLKRGVWVAEQYPCKLMRG